MGQAKQKAREGFSPVQIEQWEAEDCVNFAIALARKTGWLLHVDWWSPKQEGVPETEMIPLRVYVADNSEGVFDVRGVKNLMDFMAGTTAKLAKQRGRGYGGVLTRYYSEAKLMGLPLRCAADEDKIAQAMQAIEGNVAFLSAIPPRHTSGIPAHDAARYTYGRCVAFAEAMRELSGLRPAAILVKRFAPAYAKTQRRAENGYVHSIVVHGNGMGEDAWGIAPVADIARRFGAIDFEVDETVHNKVVENYQRNSPDMYEAELVVARELIAKHRTSGIAQCGFPLHE